MFDNLIGQKSESGSRIAHFEELDIHGNTLFDGFSDQHLRNHPAVSDQSYRKRRQNIIDISRNTKGGLPKIEYTPEEIKTWGIVLNAMKEELPTKACKEYNKAFEKLSFQEDHIPVLSELSETLAQLSGWRLHAVCGYLQPRIFLNCLAFKVFPVIPFIRHHDKPFYSIEPDICHEILGHVPMLADPCFGELCAALGKASLNASDEDVAKIANVYWHFVEFGLLWESENQHYQKTRKAFGAAVVSCLEELNNSLDEKIVVHDFDPFICAKDGDHPVTLLQPYYYAAQSISEARMQIINFVNALSNSVTVRGGVASSRPVGNM